MTALSQKRVPVSTIEYIANKSPRLYHLMIVADQKEIDRLFRKLFKE